MWFRGRKFSHGVEPPGQFHQHTGLLWPHIEKCGEMMSATDSWNQSPPPLFTVNAKRDSRTLPLRQQWEILLLWTGVQEKEWTRSVFYNWINRNSNHYYLLIASLSLCCSITHINTAACSFWAPLVAFVVFSCETRQTVTNQVWTLITGIGSKQRWRSSQFSEIWNQYHYLWS